MLNDKQIQIADSLLKHLESRDGKSSKDDYPGKMQKLGFDYPDVAYICDILINQLELLDYWGDDKYWITLTPDGYKAAKLGLKKYFEILEQEKQLDILAKQASIDGVKKANRNSIIAIVFAFIVPISITLFENYPRINNSRDNRDKNGNVRSDVDLSKFPDNRTDTIFIEKVKYSLKHDSLFLNDVKKLIINDINEN